jgi:hypothetical protein
MGCIEQEVVLGIMMSTIIMCSGGGVVLIEIERGGYTFECSGTLLVPYLVGSNELINLDDVLRLERVIELIDHCGEAKEEVENLLVAEDDDFMLLLHLVELLLHSRDHRLDQIVFANGMV